MTSAFPAHVMMRQPMQFGLDQRDQLIERAFVSVPPIGEQLGDFLL
jgi:hypothetical protein